ncbi:MAG: MobA-like NTP transferase domain-containing protein [Candidatus Electronema aureum]|uniref:MobA-like NTP transferase domain-containing protein n=1 Tax=Candidatus Electronema aureum TaxID=2005002 RepID=A0A521G2E1_9BACT|nr:MAG: MobA-like NTP transferase domain-containing protein [Candidatus Electronema aureum]
MPLTAIILAGGKQTRLRDIGLSCPKALAELSGTPLLNYQIRQLQQVATSIIIAGGRLSDIFYRIYATSSPVKISPDPVIGTGVALLEAAKIITDDHLIICNADTVNDLPLQDIVDHYFLHYASLCMIVLTRREGVQNSGAFAVDASNRVIRSYEDRNLGSPPHPEAVWHGASTGVIMMPRRLLRNVHPFQSHSLEQDILPELIWRGKVYAFDNGTSFSLDIGTPERFGQFAKIKKDVLELFQY